MIYLRNKKIIFDIFNKIFKEKYNDRRYVDAILLQVF